jgi:hypothetical protein
VYIRRNIRAGCSERIYHVVKNAMSIQAETGRVMFYLTGGYGIGTVSSWVLASYASELLRENFWGQMAGVVQNGPIGPGEYGLVVAHGWVSSALNETGLGRSSCRMRQQLGTLLMGPLPGVLSMLVSWGPI